MAPRYEKLMDNELNRFWGIDYSNFVSLLIDNINFDRDDAILDIATGTGYIPAYIHKTNKTYRKIFGLDITLDMLRNSYRNLTSPEMLNTINFVCASAHAIPLGNQEMDHVICCLATHHMDVDMLLDNIKRCLKTGGNLHLADAGGSSKWKNWIIKNIIKALAFIYFLFVENFSRARAESSAIKNIHTANEWRQLMKEKGFNNIEINEMKSKHFWAPDPLIINASK